MRKAISEVVVVVMLLMISVALVGVAYVFVMGFQEQAKSEVQQTGTEAFKKVGSCLQTVSFDDKTNNLQVRNCGKYPLENVTVFIDNNPISSVALNAKHNEVKNLAIGVSSGVHEIMLVGDYVSATTSINVVNQGVLGKAMVLTAQDEFDFSLVLSPSKGSAVQGSGVSASVGTALMKGVSRIISLSCSGLPAGASCSFSLSSINATNGTSTLAISTDLATPAGEYPIVVTGTAGGGASRTAIYNLTIEAELKPPSVSVSGAPAKWQSANATASIACEDSESGCDAKTFMLKAYSADPGSCPNNYNEYALPSPAAISSHVWICGAAKDKAGNAGFSSPVEFMVDAKPPAMDCNNANQFSIYPTSPNDYENITISAKASDNIAVSKIEIYADGSIRQTCNSGQCSKTIGPYQAGATHVVAAKAYDAAGNKAECSKSFSVVPLSANCKAAMAGQLCDAGDIGKDIVCRIGCINYMYKCG